MYAQSSTGEIHWECPKSQDVPVPTVRCYAKQEWCGDGVTQSGEECDNGNSNGKNGECSSTCKKNICIEKTTLKGPCQLVFEIEVNWKKEPYYNLTKYIRESDQDILNLMYNCYADSRNYNGNYCSKVANHITKVENMKITLRDEMWKYDGWYRNGCPLNISIGWLNQDKHFTCNSTFTLKLKTK